MTDKTTITIGTVTIEAPGDLLELAGLHPANVGGETVPDAKKRIDAGMMRVAQALAEGHSGEIALCRAVALRRESQLARDEQLARERIARDEFRAAEEHRKAAELERRAAGIDYGRAKLEQSR